jgi:hypothetical protein
MKSHLTPAFRAQRSLLPRDLVATKAGRRKKQIAHPPRNVADQSADHSHFFLRLVETKTRYIQLPPTQPNIRTGPVQSVFDKKAITSFRQRAVAQGKDGADFLLAHVASEMADRLSFIDRKFERAAVTSGNLAFLDQDFLAGTRHAGTVFVNEDPEPRCLDFDKRGILVFDRGKPGPRDVFPHPA